MGVAHQLAERSMGNRHEMHVVTELLAPVEAAMVREGVPGPKTAVPELSHPPPADLPPFSLIEPSPDALQRREVMEVCRCRISPGESALRRQSSKPQPS